MSALEIDFKQLHALIEQKKGDFRLWYKIPGDGLVSAYDILNSPKVEGYFRARSQTCDPLQPGRVNTKVLDARYSAAMTIARGREVQNKDTNFVGVASAALDAAKAILGNSSMCAGYSAWLKKQTRASDPEAEEAERARRKAEKKRLRELERKLMETEERATKAEEERARIEREARERELELLSEPEPEPEPEPEQPSKPGWADVVLKLLGAAAANARQAPPQPAPANISGAWSSYDGMPHYFVQSGSAVSFQVSNLLGIVVTQGQGRIVDGRITVSFQTMTPFGPTYGEAEADVSPDGRRIQGYFHNHHTGNRGIVNLYR